MKDCKRIFDRIYQKAAKEVPHLQPWRGHFLVRKIETEILAERFNFRKDAVGLELGCGCAFQSALLRSVSNRILATDLFRENGACHSLGIKRARDLIRQLNIDNVEVISCSATRLPFPDNYFDFVFLSSVLEHIKDRESALVEIGRVLKPEGRLILIVPTHMASIYAFPHVFLYLLARSLKLLFHSPEKRSNSAKRTDSAEGENNLRQSLFARFRKNHPSFPLPEPHGSYRNIFEELTSQLPSNWIKLLEKSGFIVKDTFALCLFPWLLIEPFSTMAAARTYSLTKNINLRLSSLKGLRNISYLMGVIAMKDNHH